MSDSELTLGGQPAFKFVKAVHATRERNKVSAQELAQMSGKLQQEKDQLESDKKALKEAQLDLDQAKNHFEMDKITSRTLMRTQV